VRAGELIGLPTDTVYGLACTAASPEPARRLYALKGRKEIQPTALVVASVDVLLDVLPELDDRARIVCRSLLPGPYTLVVPNPARRFAWLCGERPEAIGVRVPALGGQAKAIVEDVDAIVATSANLAGGRDPWRLADVPPRILAGVTAVIDGGELPGIPSTVVDITGEVPRILRQGAVTAARTRSLLAGGMHAGTPPD
jgi:L-threonylcarbamoyladenylate synthase